LRDIQLVLGQQVILERISFELHRNEILTLIGPNGSGKTSLLKVILGLYAPTQGAIWRAPELRIGYLPQKLRINPALPVTVERFLALAGRNRNEQIRACLSRVGAEHCLKSPLRAISGGELQRVLLARALLRQPHLMILDEPAQGVDLQGQQALYHLLTELRDELHCAILLVSHDLHLVMAATDRVICLSRHICCSGTPESVQCHPEYHNLFDPILLKEIAIYTHHHDHHHDLHGNVVITDEDHPA
jgi:zinc transport system ATP-binding protein